MSRKSKSRETPTPEAPATEAPSIEPAKEPAAAESAPAAEPAKGPAVESERRTFAPSTQTSEPTHYDPKCKAQGRHRSNCDCRGEARKPISPSRPRPTPQPLSRRR